MAPYHHNSDRHFTLARIAFWAALTVAVVFSVLSYIEGRGTQQDTKDVACATASFASDLGDQFRGALARTQARVGTPSELSTDREGVQSLKNLLEAFDHMAETVNPICGPVVVAPPSPPNPN